MKAILICVASVHADQILWSYSLDELPPGWGVTSGEWSFQPDGAHSYAEAALYETQWNELVSGSLVLPMGTDSISISAQQYSVTWETDASNTFSFNRMVLFINGESGIYWNVSGNITDSLPVFVIFPALAGDTLEIHLICAATSFPDPPIPPPGVQATADFHIWDFVVTAYGSIGLDPASWGGIKSKFP